MLSLDDIRSRINHIDNELLRLLSERRQVSLAVAQSKQQTTKAVRDITRERQLLAQLITQGSEHQLDAAYVTRIFQLIIEDSVLLQQSYLAQQLNSTLQQSSVKVAFVGSQGSYGQLAADKYFARLQRTVIGTACRYPAQAIEQVEQGLNDFAVLAIENTSSGSINEVYDLMQHTTLAIIGEVTCPIEHALVAKQPLASHNIRHLFLSHQAMQQCSQWLHSLSPEPQYHICPNSIDALQAFNHSSLDQAAVIANPLNASEQGLTVLQPQLANHQENSSRFIIVARHAVDVPPQSAAKTTLVMATGQTPGALVQALLVLQQHHLAMTKLESRPMQANPAEELFYLDIAANINDSAMQHALAQLSDHTKFVKVLGCYPCEQITPATPEFGE